MNQEIPYELLAKYFAGGCNEKEISMIKEWREKDSAHEKVYSELNEIWDHSNTGDESFTPPVSVALEKVNKKIRMAENPVSAGRKQKTPMYFFIRIAALFMLSLGLWYAYDQFITKEDYITEKNLVKSIREIILEDGTVVTLNSQSMIKYPEKFGKKSRNIELEGEAYFEVTKNPDRPFIIKAQNTVTKVMGTAFNLRAVPEEDEVILTVMEGEVSFSNEIQDKNQSLILINGERGIVFKSTNIIRRETNEDANFMAWKTGQLIFNNTPLKKVAKDLSKFYGVEFRIGSAKLDTVIINHINFNQSTLEKVMEVFDFWGIAFVKTADGYVIEEKSNK